jgi:anti-sigma28 factor (negative regulator of flagellin synthesis)
MQIDTTTGLGTLTSEVSRRSSAASSGINARSKEYDRFESSNSDTVQTKATDLVHLVLQSQDKASEARLARLQQEYESGAYLPRAHEVARAILAGGMYGGLA